MKSSTTTAPKGASQKPPAEEAQPKAAAPKKSEKLGWEPFAELVVREGAGSRTSDDATVRRLAQDIRLRGLLQPLVIDDNKDIIDGRHRFAALDFLRSTDPKWFVKTFKRGIPVVRRPFARENDLERAVREAMVANAARKAPSPRDIDQYIRDLISTEEFAVSEGGRPSAGKRSLSSVVKSDLKVSDSTAKRLIRRARGEKEAAKGPTLAGFCRAVSALRARVPPALGDEATPLFDQLDALAARQSSGDCE
jgi:hypothetical protein